ncbi:uncharacterized protein TNCV_3623471 [Trichonephila clavipes]|nr:uncharacterized protein TNCV_3623471 [Trichonephila clavipes]
MEVDGMLRIFNRSEKLHNLKYLNYIEDGDTKTFNALSENKPYGDDHLIQKIECVGHVQKRMSTRLRKLKLVYSKKKLSDGKTIGGKGRVDFKDPLTEEPLRLWRGVRPRKFLPLTQVVRTTNKPNI